VAAAALFALAIRLPFVGDPLQPDEGGYYLVAQQWSPTDHALYGHYWVDRPPLLLLAFKAAALLGGPHGVRLLGCLLALLLVAGAAAAGHAIGGSRAARWSAAVAGCLGSSYALGAYAVDGELVAAPLVMACCAATLWATKASVGTRRHLLATFAGLAGAAAVFVKQNFADGLVFAVVLVGVSMLKRYDGRRDLLRVLLSGVAGVAAVVGVMVAWASVLGPGLGPMLYAMYGFRLDSAEAIAAGDTSRPEERLVVLVLLAFASGLVFLVAWALRIAGSRLRRRDPVACAFLAMTVFGVVGVAAGGSYWQHYLVELVPAAAIGAALTQRDHPRSQVLRYLAGFAAVSAVVASVVGFRMGQVEGEAEQSVVTTGQWIRAASEPGDTALVTYGHANIQLEAGLPSPYPYLWSLPMRVRDPHLTQLVALLEGPKAPTYVVEWNPFDSWQLDDSGDLARAVSRRYHQVATLCGHDVYLLDSAPRTTPAITGRCGAF